MTASPTLLPGATLGMLGGGQLGRMFTLAARRMGYRVHVFDPGANSPAGELANRHVQAAFDDADALRDFAAGVDAVSLEFENIPVSAIEAVAAAVPVRPGGAVLHTTQNRLREKRALVAAGVPTVRFAEITDDASLGRAVEEIGAPAILKTAAWGYDGKGQTRLDAADGGAAAWEEIGRQPAILEAFAPFEREVSVVGVRGADGQVALYEPADNTHSRHILDVSVAPADLPERTRTQAHDITRTLLEAWDVVGVMCVELFLLPEGELLVNEIAPRPHNSGHLTIEACRCSQFESQVRAVAGLPLGSTAPVAPAAMANLLGDLWVDGEPDWAAASALPVSLHLYGKTEARPGRKMGHLTAVADTPAAARDAVLAARKRLTSRS